MNQIIVTEKVYVTPELKRKKKFFRFYFLLSVFCACILFSYYIYAEYDRNKSEEVSKTILEQVEFNTPAEEAAKQDKIVVVLNEESEDVRSIDIDDLLAGIIVEEAYRESSEYIENIDNLEKFTTDKGTEYYVLGQVNIPKIEVNYPILYPASKESEDLDELLKISPCKFWGPSPNREGNLCIVGHNYRNRKFFSKVPTLVNGDIIEITDQTNTTLQYEVYDSYVVQDTDTACTAQDTNGKKEVTLITCTNDSKERVIVKAREILL